MDQGNGRSLILIHRISSAFAETLSWPGRRVEMTASRLLPIPSGKGRFTRCSASPLTPIVGRHRADPEENRDPGPRHQLRECLTARRRLENGLDPEQTLKIVPMKGGKREKADFG